MVTFVLLSSIRVCLSRESEGLTKEEGALFAWGCAQAAKQVRISLAADGHRGSASPATY